MEINKWESLENLQKEIWKDIKGYEGLYQVSSYGRIKRLPITLEYYNSNQYNAHFICKYKKSEKIIKLVLSDNWYSSVVLRKNKKGKIYKLHRLVAQAFIPNPDNLPQVNHKNGVKNDNRVENLEWISKKDNMNHSIKTGLRKLRKVCQYDVNGNFIKEWFCVKEAQKYFNKKYNINSQGIYKYINTDKILYGYKWKYKEL